MTTTASDLDNLALELDSMAQNCRQAAKIIRTLKSLESLKSVYRSTILEVQELIDAEVKKQKK